MPQTLFETLRDAGVFRIVLPRALGGFELDDESTARVIEALSRHDGAVGWNVMIASSIAASAGWTPQSPIAEIYATDPQAVVAGGIRPLPENVALPTEGGYILHGRWPLASGCHQANWMVGICFVTPDTASSSNIDGKPELRYFFWPRSETTILETWHTTGLRGTGSDDIEVFDLFVPTERSVAVRASDWTFVSAHVAPLVAAVAVGIARAAIDAFKELALGKTPHASQRPLAQQPTVSATLGRAEALLRSARAYLYATIRESRVPRLATEPVSDEVSANIRLASAHAAHTAAEAVDLMFTAGGISSVYASSRLDRCFRDVHVVTQHIQVATSNIEMVGAYLLHGSLGIRP